MDARWAAHVVQTGTVLVSVGYRLAPEHPYPTPIEDCVDAIRWVHAHAQEYDWDLASIWLSGFSVGGNMVFAAAMMLHNGGLEGVNLAAIFSFYPLLDRTLSREDKYRMNPIAAEKVSTPKSWDKLFVDCYLRSNPAVDLSAKYLSPGLALDEVLREALPTRITIMTCGWDALLEEGEVFRKRLVAPGQNVGGRIVEEAAHTFDRVPSRKPSTQMDKMYSDALVQLKEKVR